jgi:hypothetical protein
VPSPAAARGRHAPVPLQFFFFFFFSEGLFVFFFCLVLGVSPGVSGFSLCSGSCVGLGGFLSLGILLY